MAEQGGLDTAVAGNWGTQKRRAGGEAVGSSSDPMTVNGYDKGEVVSALQKAIRRGQEPEALYWACELVDSNEAYRMWRRLIVIGAEDVGLAEPDMCGQILLLSQAYDKGREMNIVFLAIMRLCRAKKNREADDASYFYEMRRKAGWRMKMPPEAIDGHTRRGRTDLYRMAREQQTTFEDLWNREFYFDVALLANYVEIESGGVPERYRKAMMEFFHLPFDTYDIDNCRQPRIRTSGLARRGSMDSLGDGAASGAGITRLSEAVLHVQSFTDPETYYEVELDRDDPIRCSCPAFANRPDGVCKHMLAASRWLPKEAKK